MGVSILLTDRSGRALAPDFQSTAIGGATGSGAGIAAAQQSPSRGYVPATNRRQKFVLTGEPRRIVVDKMRWLQNNSYGTIASRVASWVGPVRPDPKTGDKDLDKEYRQWWQDTAVDSLNYDASGKFNAQSYQEMAEVISLVQGDCLTVFTTDDAGFPICRFFDSLAVDNPWGMMNGKGNWWDGVMVDAGHRHLAYRILRDDIPDEANFWQSYRGMGYVVPAAAAYMHGHWKHPADVRGTSAFLAAINPMIDLQEVDMAVIELIKVAARVGFSIESQNAGGSNDPAPLEGPFAFQPTAPANTSSRTTDTGEPVRLVEQVLGGPAVAHLDPGQKINMHAVDRDIPSYDETRGNTLEKIAFSFGLPVQMLFGLFTGRFNISGPGIRLTLGDSHQWRNRRLQRRAPFVKRDYARRLQHAIDNGIVPRPKKSTPAYWRCEARGSEAYTIDVGRDANADKSKLQLGAESLKRLAAERGSDSFTIIEERLEELEHMYNEGCVRRGLPLALVFPASVYGITGSTTESQPARDDTPPDVTP
jgi:capsid protein